MLGFPDYGLTIMTEMAANAGRIASAVKVPVIADADTGFGNELDVTRGGKSPVPDLRRVEDMGYRIAILPGLLLMHVIGSCRQILGEAREKRSHPVPLGDISIAEMWRVVGADAWDAVQAAHK